MSKQSCITAILRAATGTALRRVLRQPGRLWKNGPIWTDSAARCLLDTLDGARITPYRNLRDNPVSADACHSWDEMYQQDAARAVREIKQLAREEIKRRGLRTSREDIQEA